MYTLEVNHPDFPKGWEFDMDGILVKNGSSVKITKEMEEAFPGRSGGFTVKEIYGHKDVPDYIKLTGTSVHTSGGDE